jgi:CTP:molybdopterin cytidylyltransferase MocA
MTRFAGLILGGGEGKRYGGPKAFVRLPDHRTFLEACRDTLTTARARPVAATLPPGFTADGVFGLRPLPLPEPGLDMLASLRWGLRHLIGEAGWMAVVVQPVDHPLVAPESVIELVAADASVAVPCYDGKHGHPVCLRRGVAEGIARGQLLGDTLRDVLKTVGIVDVEVDDPGVIANCNTPESLARWLDRASE